jgi:non-ribosomal peptide synthetase component F
MEQGFAQFAKRSAYVGMGTPFSFAEWDQRSTALAAWLQARGLRPLGRPQRQQKQEQLPPRPGGRR